MARRFYLVSYDVKDDRRRARIAKVLLDYGDRVQYSVFCCQLNARERVCLRRALGEQLHRDDDQALILDAGPVEGQQPAPEVEYVGVPYRPAPRCQIV